MPRPMTKYQIEKTKVEKHSFVMNPRNFRHKEYHEYGVLKCYANKKQADNKIAQLRLLGFDTGKSKNHPYTIILSEI